MKVIIAAAIASGSFAVHAHAAGWPQEDVDQAIAVVTAREKDSIEECVVSSGTRIAYDVQQKDLNSDGINELVVSSFPAELGNGATGCYGMVGKNMYLLSNESGTWRNLTGGLGDNASSFDFHAREAGEMPDIEVTGPGFCFPIHRYSEGEYRSWKTCNDEGKLVLAADDKGTQVISDDDAQAMVNNREIFDHNGSAMIIDPDAGTIIYRDPKKAIAGTVKSGALLFKANAGWDPYDDTAVIKGVAYVFKKGCEPAPYEVSGRQHGWHTLVLKGPAPVREKTGCKVIGYKNNGNSTLKFESWGD